MFTPGFPVLKAGDLSLVLETNHGGGGGGGGGVLRYISDGDVRSPFLGLKFAI